MKFQGELLDYFDVENFVNQIFGKSQHAKRLKSIANAALGIIASASLIIHRIGRGLAKSLGLSDKHAIKQVDRLLSNDKFVLEETDEKWVPFVIGSRKEVKITMDWTEFDLDKQATISLNLVTNHGRATPLLSKTVLKKKLKNHRNDYEDEILNRLRHVLPKDVKVTILADRGFCDIKLLEFIKNELGFEYCIRIRNNIHVTDTNEVLKKASDWVGLNGKTKTLRNAKITSQKYEVPSIAMKHAKGMKEPWCVVSSETNISGSMIIQWYSKRWGCEPQFRDTKDIHFGMGLYETHISRPERRDRLLLISAIATVLLTLLGAAGEALGLDRQLKANTSKKRTLSLFSQGCILFNKIPKMLHQTAIELLTKFSNLIIERETFSEILFVI